MTARAELRTKVRTELNDGGGTPLWTDAALNQWIDEAIRDYAEELPREVSASITTVAAQADYALPSDFDRVLLVEHPTGVFRTALRKAGGDVPFSTDPTLAPTAVGARPVWAYDVWGGQLSLDPAPTAGGETIKLRYLATYALPTADGSVLATPTRDDPLLIWLVCDRALSWLGTDESKRQRFERQRGVSAQEAAGGYERQLRDAYAQRHRRLRAQRLAVRP